MSRLSIDVTEQQHQTLKALAALEGKTIKQYALERLFPPHIGEEQAAYELKSLLSQRLAEARRDELAEGSISDIADDLLKRNRTK
ncbi:antitoxin [Geoalkalibacter halelectricus]|uniref:Antitoxin n=1 Tax=Geoalkalibacter halelectricus TaxID=2847045 RepID=A0ABY5ZMZ3_9BACT|nr:antitoxin [Geoalkalibacter halelectricus]MDO3377308.1 antitoxin [Geoalkalibacter halelectricus]UWZ79180.1 antitoxin [Geoalkalibacter halelectricus]